MSGLPELVRSAGIVGAGGAGFPSHVKLSAKVDTFIANAAECEPLLASDKVLILIHTEAVLAGLREAARAVGAKRVVFATKRTYTEVLQRLRLHDIEGIELFELEDFYPAGDEQILVHEVTGRVVPPGGIPLDVGVVVHNVGTLFAIHNARSGRPFIDRYVTVVGEVSRPGVYRVPIGTPTWWLVKEAGASAEEYTIFHGGPMMGRLVEDPQTPITKTTSGVLVLPKDHELSRKYSRDLGHWVKTALAACTQCTRCTQLCPRHLLGHPLEPHRIMRSLAGGEDIQVDTLAAAFLCSQCGVCELYACPMDLSPRKVYAMVREELVAKGVRYSKPKGSFRALEAYGWSKVPKHRIMERLDITRYDKARELRKTSGLPPYLELPLKQHIGAPALPVVRRGQKVRQGDLIGEIPEGKLGARVHAPLDGVVAYVDSDKVIVEVSGGG